MSPFYDFQSYPNTYCTKLKCTPPPSPPPKLPLGHQKWTPSYAKTPSTNVHKFINSSKYSYISIHDGHGLMMMYDIHMHLNSLNIIISDGLEYIEAIFNINIQK
jgi:hypothetical protein